MTIYRGEPEQPFKQVIYFENFLKIEQQQKEILLQFLPLQQLQQLTTLRFIFNAFYLQEIKDTIYDCEKTSIQILK